MGIPRIAAVDFSTYRQQANISTKSPIEHVLTLKPFALAS
jgi:hypothetical protein